MVFTSILRKTASTLASRLGRSGQRNFNAALFTAVSRHADFADKRPSFVPFPEFYSTAVDTKTPSSTDSLLRVIESEIQMAQETDDYDRIEEIPKGFPFKIEDTEGQQTVILTREYEGEVVKVEVHMPDLVTGEDNEIGDDQDDNDTETPPRSSIQLVVTVSKKSGTSLEFACVAFPDEIAIDSLSVKKAETSEDQYVYEGPNFGDLDENLKKAFHKYLEIRGIKPSTTNFLHEYMINKDSREYMGWLKNLKKFVEA